MPREISPEELAERLRAGRPVLLLDVREDRERGIVRLPGDVHVPLHDLPARAPAISVPPGAEVVVYCHHGIRSWAAADYLEQARGWSDVASLAGGVDAWSRRIDRALPRY